MWVDEKFLFYCLCVLCGFALLESFRGFQIWQLRRKKERKFQNQLREVMSDQGYQKAVDMYHRLSKSTMR
jgi:hypothetical protein